MNKIKMMAAIKCLKNNKSAEIDGATAELLKYGKNGLVKWMTRFFNEIGQKEEMPAESTKGW